MAKLKPSITIVTAFFDIGRNSWESKELPTYLKRSNQTYFQYFTNLAQLDNEIIVFTSSEFIDKILEIRKNRPTKVIDIDLKKEFTKEISIINSILVDPHFLQKIPIEQQKNPEYWCAEYVLINNLKTCFVNQAIKNNYTHNELIAWVDFGYCRNQKILSGIKNWYYPFNHKYVHLFTLKRHRYLSIYNNPRFPHSKSSVLSAIFNNRAYIIGGVIVADKEHWQQFNKVVKQSQHELIQQRIIDDDQGVYLMCHLNNPKLIQLHYLGKNKYKQPNWFGVMQKFHK